jgi:spore coat-associated protein N
MSGKLLKSAVVVGTAASFAVLGAAADLADASRGRVQAKGPQLLIAGRNVQRARAVAPGDRIERTIVLRVRGRGELRLVALAVRAKRASLLTDRKLGLRLSLERCSRSWKHTIRAHSYTCRGRRTRLLTRKPVLGKRRLGLLLHRGGMANLRLTLTLPTQAGNALQGQTSTLVYRFTAVAQATR